MKTPKRFIAGAICPACKETDTLVMWSEGHIPHRECMICGFTDTLEDSSEPSQTTELKTRVTSQKPLNQEVKAIKFFVNPKLNKKLH